MTVFPTEHIWMTRLAGRRSSSSGAHVLNAHIASCVLDLLAQARPQSHSARKAVI